MCAGTCPKTADGEQRTGTPVECQFLLFGNSVGNYVSVSVCETSTRWRHLENARFREGFFLTAVTERDMSQNAFMKLHLNTTRTEMSFEMLFGYARVSTDDQRLDLQHDALIRAGVERDRIFEDKLSVRAVNAASEGRFSTKSRHQNVCAFLSFRGVS